MSKKHRIIVIVGPTASGKSALAVAMARRFGGEVISADSRQVYRGLEIGSGAMTRKEMRGVPHHLIGITSPHRAFTAAQYVSRARRVIAAVARRGKIPIVCGGTAFWIDALVYDFSLPEVAPDARLRRALEKKSPAQLLSMLKKLDPRRAADIERENSRRLIRAIEIARALGRVPRLQRRPAYDALWIGMRPDQDAWMRGVTRRVRGMIRRGLVAETEKLIRRGMSERRVRELGFEYSAALDVIAKKIPRRELSERMIRDTARYARRQMRWWKRNPGIRWIMIPIRAISLVRTFLGKNP